MSEYTFPIILLFSGFVFGAALLLLNDKQVDNSWKKTIKTNLDKLDELSKSKDINTLKSLLIEADKLLGYALEKAGVEGNGVGDRLKNAKEKIGGKDLKKGERVSQTEWKRIKKKKELYTDIWDAHKLRNKLAHEIDANPTSKELKTSYLNLKKGIKTLL